MSSSRESISGTCSSPTHVSPPSLKSTSLQDVMNRRNRLQQSRQALPWALLNFSLVVLIIFEIRYSFILPTAFQSFSTLIYLIEILLILLFSTNAIYDGFLYCWPYIWMKPIEVTESQKKLLGIKDNEIGFTTVTINATQSTDQPTSTPNKSNLSNATSPTPPFEISLTNNSFSLLNQSQRSFHSSFNSSSTSNINTSLNLSNSMTNSPFNSTSSSWVYHQGNPYSSPSSPITNTPNISQQQQITSSPDENSNPNNSLLRLRKFAKVNPNKSITDEASLRQYLKDYEDKEERMEEMRHMEKMQEQLNGSSQLMTRIDESSAYQTYIRSPIISVSGEDTMDKSLVMSASPTSSRALEAILIKLKTNESEMNQWIENIRKWLSQTILMRLVDEIDKINDSLIAIGSMDSLIGEASFTDIKQAANLKKSQIPSFESVIAYLDLTSNQQYLVRRLKDLAKGGCMSEFNWNAGGFYNRKPWNEDLPTDSAIMMHLLCTYMDSRLPYNPNCPEGKAFTKQHYKSMTGEVPKGSIYVSQVKVNPPHYKVVEDETWELPMGRNNLFHTLIVFLHCVKVKQYGLLGRINLGKSGLNILWVIEK